MPDYINVFFMTIFSQKNALVSHENMIQDFTTFTQGLQICCQGKAFLLPSFNNILFEKSVTLWLVHKTNLFSKD